MEAATNSSDWQTPGGRQWVWQRSKSHEATPYDVLENASNAGYQVATRPASRHKHIARSRDEESLLHEVAKAHLSILRIMRLFAGDEDGNREDDYGAIAPSVYALQAALVLVAGAIKIMREDIPGVPVVDSEGGIRITWKQGDRLVRLVCPAAKEGQLYIYQSSAGVNSILNQNVTAEALATRLATLVAREPVAD